MAPQYQVILTLPDTDPEYISPVYTDLRLAIDALYDELDVTGDAGGLSLDEIWEAKKLVNTIEVEKCIMLGGYEHKLVRVALPEVELYEFREKFKNHLFSTQQGTLGEIAGRLRQLGSPLQYELNGTVAFFHITHSSVLVVRFPRAGAQDLYAKLISLVRGES